MVKPTNSDALFADIEYRLAGFEDLRLASMDAAGIGVSVLSVTTPRRPTLHLTCCTHPGLLPDKPAMFAGRPELDGPVWAWTADTGAHALHLIFGGTCKRFLRLKIILGHMGETLPYLRR